MTTNKDTLVYIDKANVELIKAANWPGWLTSFKSRVNWLIDQQLKELEVVLPPDEHEAENH